MAAFVSIAMRRRLFLRCSHARRNGSYFLFQLLGDLPDSVQRVRLKMRSDLLNFPRQNFLDIGSAYV